MSKTRRKLTLALAALMALGALAQAGAVFAAGLMGAEDGIAPPPIAAAYAAKMKGAHIRQFVLADTGHVELIAPGSAAWSRVTESIDAFFRSP